MAGFEVIFFGNELPKGDVQDVFRKLHDHSKDASHPLLASFIAEATRTLREEVGQLPSETRQLIPPFDSVLAWADMTQLRESPLCGAVEGVLLVVAQIGAYIG